MGFIRSYIEAADPYAVSVTSPQTSSSLPVGRCHIYSTAAKDCAGPQARSNRLT